MPQIANARGVSHQFVHKLVNKLLEAETLLNTENPSHKISRYGEVTPRGREIYGRAPPILRSMACVTAWPAN